MTFEKALSAVAGCCWVTLERMKEFYHAERNSSIAHHTEVNNLVFMRHKFKHSSYVKFSDDKGYKFRFFDGKCAADTLLLIFCPPNSLEYF